MLALTQAGVKVIEVPVSTDGQTGHRQSQEQDQAARNGREGMAPAPAPEPLGGASARDGERFSFEPGIQLDGECLGGRIAFFGIFAQAFEGNLRRSGQPRDAA